LPPSGGDQPLVSDRLFKAARLLISHSNLVSTSAADLALIILSASSGILVARLLGPTARGEFAVAILWPSVIAALGTLGLREALTYERARALCPTPVLVGTALMLAMVQSVLLMGFGAVLIPWLTRAQSPGVTEASLLFVLFIPTNLVAHYSLGLLQGSLEIPVFNALRLVVSVVYLGAVLVLWALGTVTVWNLTLGLLVANGCTALAALAAVLAKCGVRWGLDVDLLGRLLGYGLRNHVGSISSMLNQRVDQMLMAVLITPKQLGWYVVAVNVSSLARLPSGAFATLAFPKVASVGSAEQRRLTSLYSRLNATATLGLGLVLVLLIPVLVPLVYGQAYSPSVFSAEILAVATVFMAIGQAWAGSLRGLGRPSEPARAEAISLAATMVGLALLLIPLGILGAALTSLVAYLLASVYMFLRLRRLLSVGLRDLLWPVSLVAIWNWLAI
jgi:O-antigen/teichoic acid export membrane protein